MNDRPFLVMERDGPVVVATLNRPDARDAISQTAGSEEIAANSGHLDKRTPEYMDR